MSVLNNKLHDAGGMTILWGHYATEESSVENRADFSVRLVCCSVSTGADHCSALITRVLRAIICIKILDRASIRLSPSLQPDSGEVP